MREDYFNVYNKDRKLFAERYSKMKGFNFVMKLLYVDNKDLEKYFENAVKKIILKECNSLSKAKDLLERIK